MANLGNKHPTAGEAVTPRLKTEASVSCPTEALFLQRFSRAAALPQRNLVTPSRLNAPRQGRGIYRFSL